MNENTNASKLWPSLLLSLSLPMKVLVKRVIDAEVQEFTDTIFEVVRGKGGKEAVIEVAGFWWHLNSPPYA
jgi:hypothetical protein